VHARDRGFSQAPGSIGGELRSGARPLATGELPTAGEYWSS